MLKLTDSDILQARGGKNNVDPRRPYAFINEPEHAAAGVIENVATLFLTNRECPFRCLMCDLWQNTTDESVAVGDIPEQIAFALKQLPPAQQIKLYNSGNFFDRKAIPRADWPAIAELVAPFNRVIVENHPKLCNSDCVSFRDMIPGKLEVAMGLETVHPTVLPRLNKRMTLDDFERATTFLLSHDIDVRAFILLRPPYLSEEEGIEWAIKSIEFAFQIGVQCCAVIPTRPGNGAIEQLEAKGQFSMPAISSIEHVLATGLSMQKGRVFMDTWDLERFYDCKTCGPGRQERLHEMNLSQQITPAISCTHC
ncbi:MAG: radical SAM protein [Rhodothermales bacterium]